MDESYEIVRSYRTMIMDSLGCICTKSTVVGDEVHASASQRRDQRWGLPDMEKDATTVHSIG